jgi:hypothetical protein
VKARFMEGPRLLSLLALASLASTIARADATPAEVTCVPSTPAAPGGDKFGFPRAIPFSRSASRDAPGFALAMAPRGMHTAAGEFGFVVYQGHGLTLRPGFYGLLELEGNQQTGFGFWSQQIHFWRGAYSLQASLAFDDIGHRLCSRCALEFTLRARHESEHYTGVNSGGSAIDYSDRPLIGDAAVFDVATALWRGHWLLIIRALDDFFLPGRSSYSRGPGLDLHLRYAAWRRIHPFFSGYAEYLFGTERGDRSYPDAYLVRGLLGIALPGSLGDLMVFVTGDVGHRKGLAAYAEEATLGFGVRLAFGSMPGM